MKRLSEIVGHTPMFVRWAIGQRCDMRDDCDGSQPFAVEKHLHSIKTAANAVAENRVVEGIAMHPSAWQTETTEQDVLGFQIDEPTAAFGGIESVTSTCQSCSACVPVDGLSLAANCFGWLILNIEDLPFRQLLDDAAPTDDGAFDEVPTTNPHWYAWWLLQNPNPAQMSTIEKCVNRLNELTDFSHKDWVIFGEAIKCCLTANLQLFMELVPAGFSDGIYWTIGPFCPDCMYAQDVDRDQCIVCGRNGKPHPCKKRRAKGLRPYLRLVHLIGPEKSRQLLNQCRGSQ